MNNQFKSLIYNFGYTFFANAVSLVVSGLLTIFVPKIYGADAYGYWQLYIFYASYIGFFHFGIQDGIYLRYGGKNYDKLDKQIMHSQFVVICVLELLIGGCIFLNSYLGKIDENRKFIFDILALNLLFYLPNTLLQYILLATNRIKESSIIILVEKFVYGSIAAICLLQDNDNFRLLLLADLCGKIISLVCCLFICKDIVFAKTIPILSVLKELYLNFRAGISLLCANIASLLITGVVKYAIQENWSIAIFGMVSLPLNLCNFFLTFVIAIGQVIFPLLKTIRVDRLSMVYRTMDNFILAFLFGLMSLFPVAKLLFQIWLPNYSTSFDYLVILLPICIYESKSNMLLATFFKALRMEKKMLGINILLVVFSLIYVTVSVEILNNLVITIYGITFLLYLRCIISELIIGQRLGINNCKSIIVETILSILFIVCNLVVKNLVAFFAYFFIVFIWILNLIKHGRLNIRLRKLY